MEIDSPTIIFSKFTDLLKSLPTSFEIENGKISVIQNEAEINKKLVKINIEVADGILNFSNFIVEHVFVEQNYEQRIEPRFVDINFAVISIEGKGVLYYEKAFYNFDAEKLFVQVETSIKYYELYNFLKSENFADHHNSADEEIIIYSSGKGIFKIKYKTIAPGFSTGIKKKVEIILDVLKEQQFRTYFKNSLFDISTGNQISLSEIIVNYKIIISAAKRDLEIALRQFDFEKFRDALYSQKDKFFINIRDVLSKNLRANSWYSYFDHSCCLCYI